MKLLPLAFLAASVMIIACAIGQMKQDITKLESRILYLEYKK